MLRVPSLALLKILKSAATFLSPVVLCLVVALGLQPSARAQVQFLGQTLSTTDYGLGESINGQPIEGGPPQVAANAAGTLAAGTYDAHHIVRINPDGTHSVAFTSPSGPIFAVAIDNAGNIYTNNQSTLWKIAPNGAVTSTDLGIEPTIQSYCTAVQNEGGENAPTCEYYTAASDLAIDPQGNIYVAYAAPLWWVLEVPAGGGHPFLLDTSPLIMNTPSGLATDSQGNVYIGDVYNNRIIVVTPVGQSNYGVSPPGLALGSPDGTVDGITLYAGVSTLGVDSQGNIYAGSTLYDGAEQFLARIDPSGQTYAMLPVGGGGVAGIGVDGQDNIYFANNDGFIVKYATKAPSFGTVAVGATPSTISLPFNVLAGTTVQSVSFMTGSAQNLDFKDAGSDTCTFPHTFSSNTTCTINISFTPTAPGVRAGALIFADGGGNVLLSMALKGTGTGSLPVFNSHAETMLTSSSLQYPIFGTTVADQSGNLYIAFAGQNEILEVPQGGASSVLSLGSATTDPQQPAISATLSGPTAVAMDNAGKLYIADTGNDRIVVRQPVQGSTTGQYFLYALPLSGLTLNAPNGVATDAAGNVYIMDNGYSRVIKVTPSGHASVLPHVNIGGQPVFGFTADAAGNLYLCGNGEVVEYAAGSSTPSVLYSGNPQGVAVDPVGDVYIADYETPGGLVEIPVGGTPQTLPIGPAGTLQMPSAVSIDSAGNLYITNEYGVDEIPRSTAALNYATTVLNQTSPDSPQTVQFANAGNASMTLSAVTYPSDFPENTSDSNLCVAGKYLVPGTACDISASFVPTQTGALSESVTIVDSATGPTQSVSLTGTGSAGGQSQTIAILNAQLVAGNICCGAYPNGPGFYVNSTSGLPITLTVLSGPLTFRGSQTTTVNTNVGSNTRLIPSASGAGSGVVQASQPGNSTYAPAAPVQLTYTVGPESIDLRTGASGTQTYGSAAPTLTFKLDGVQPGDKPGLAVTGGVSAASPVGNYTANVALTGLTAANYTLTNPTLPVTVTPAPLTVEPVDAYQLVGATPAPLNYVLAGFQNGDTASVVTGSPTLSTTANSSSPAGTYPITAGAGNLAAANYVFTNLPNGELNIFAPVNFGAVNVGSHFGTAVTFPAGLAPAAASEQLITGGSTNGAFAGSYVACAPGAPGNCTVSVSFAPTAPGLVTGAIELYDNASPANLLVSIPAYGTGVGPQIAFSGGTQSVPVDNVTGANSIAFDGLGNMYFTVGNAVTGAVYELPAGGTLTPIGTGWVRPDSVVADGLGNVYVSDYGLSEVIKLTPAGVQSTVPFNSLFAPQSLALDASGNLYVFDASDRVYQLTPAGVQTVFYAGSPADGSPLVNAIAFSPTGQMYFVDSVHGKIYTTPQGGPATLFSTAIPNAQSIAFDAAGNIYATSNAPGGMGLYQLTPTGTVTQILSEADTTYPAAVTFDQSGNLYIVNGGISTAPVEGKIIKLDRSDAPSVNFPTATAIGSTDTTDGAMTVSVQNIGNQPLTFTAPTSGTNPSYPANFTENTADTNLCASATSLAIGASCDVSMNFMPAASGTNTGSVVLTDNALNAVNATQSIQLSGTGLATQTISFTLPASPVYFGVAPITLVATGGASGNPVVFSVVSGPGNVSGTNGSTLTFTGAGTVVVAANQAGNAFYAAAAQVTQSIVVTPSAVLLSPTPGLGTKLGTSNVSFQWTTGAGVTQYQLSLGTTAGASDLYTYKGTATSINVPTLPANGVTVYATLSSKINGAWQANAYLYTESGTATPAVLTSPTPGLGTVLGTSNVAFQWSSGTGVTLYQLSLSAVGPGQSELFTYKGTSTSASVTTLPAGGLTVYATLYSFINGAWQSNSYQYYESGPRPAALTSPTPGLGTILETTNVTFVWNTGAQVANYQLNLSAIGQGQSDLFVYKGTATSAVVPTLPANGTTVYVSLYSKINGVWQSNAYQYTESGTPIPSTLTSPTPGLTTILGTSNVAFQWTVGGASTYQLNLSATTPGASDLFLYKGTASSAIVPTLPANGVTVYATLYSKIKGTWQSNSYVYTESGTPTPAALTSPTPGLSTILGTSNVMFQWSAGTSASNYQLNLSTVAPGNSELFQYKGTALSATAPTLPANGVKVYARLYSKIDGVWLYNDYVYTEQ